MLGLIDGEVDVGRRGLVTHLLLAPLTGPTSRRSPAGEPAAVALQPRGLVEAQHNDDLFGKHRCLDLAPQPAERERCDRRSQLGMRADIATPLVEGRRDVELSVLAHDAPARSHSFGRVARGASVKRHAGAGQEAGFQEWPLRCGSIAAPATTWPGADRRGWLDYPLTDALQSGILRCAPGP